MSASDLDDLLHLFQDDQVALTMAGKRTDAEVAAIVAADVEHWADHGYGCWSWRTADTGQFVGRGGLRRLFIDDVGDETELAYALMPAFWRQGLATEIARFSVAQAFDPHGLASVVAMTLPTNEGSRRVMAGAGLTYRARHRQTGTAPRAVPARPRRLTCNGAGAYSFATRVM